jgi:hypothetical protein
MALKRTKQGRSAADFLPATKSLPALKKAAASCRGCDLHKRATQTVFGEGPKDASVVFVGEQPIYRHPVKKQQELEYRRFVEEMKLMRQKLVHLEAENKKRHRERLAGVMLIK